MAVSVTSMFVATGCVVMPKGADVDEPSGTTTDAGRTTSAPPLARLTRVPPTGAAEGRTTVPVMLPVPPTVNADERFKANPAGNSVIVADLWSVGVSLTSSVYAVTPIVRLAGTPVVGIVKVFETAPAPTVVWPLGTALLFDT